MDCKLDFEYLQRYLDDTLSPLEKMIVEEHIKICDACRKELNAMKLLLWELDEFMETEIDVPAEAALVRSKVIDECIGSKRFGVKDFFAIQKNISEGAGMFLNFVPGLKPGASLLGKGMKKAPSLLYKVIESAYRGSRKLKLTRAQA